MTSIRCKFIDGQGEPIGHAEVPPMYGIVNIGGRFYGRMFNGDDDKDKFPFVFADADVLVLEQLEELKYEPTERERGRRAEGGSVPGDDRADGAEHNARGRERILRQRRNQPKAKRGHGRGTY